MLLQPGDQAIHVGDGARLRCPILAGPARKLALEIAARPAEISKPDLADIDVMERGQRAIHGVVDGSAFLVAGKVRQGRVPEDAAVDEAHDKEHAADRGILGRQEQCVGDGHFRSFQGPHHAIFAIHLVGGFQKLARRLGAQYIAAAFRP